MAWQPFVVGAMLGAGLAAVLLGTWTSTPPVDSAASSTTSTIKSTTLTSVAPGNTPVSIPSPPVFSEDQMGGALLAVTGSWTHPVLERWTPGLDEVLGPLPYGSGGDFRSDASGQFFAFRAPASDVSVATLFVGQEDRYVAFSVSASSWAWHATEPGSIAWVQDTGTDRTVMASHAQIAQIDDVSSSGIADTEVLGTVQDGEWLVAFDEWGIATASVDPDTDARSVRRIGRDGSTSAETNGMFPLAFSSSGIGVVTISGDTSATFNPMLVDRTFHILTDLGEHDGGAIDAAWSPNGNEVALVDYRNDGDLDFHLELWSVTGKKKLDIPLELRAYGVTWTADGAFVVLQATDNARWGGLLMVDRETGDISRFTVDRGTFIAVAASTS